MGKNGFTNSDVRAFKGKASGGQNWYALGDGLRVRMRGDTGFYVFIYRAKRGPRRGKKVVLTLGPVSAIDIRDAQQWARDQATILAKGDDPYNVKKAKKEANHLAALRSKTFGQAAQEYYDKRCDPNDKRPWGKDRRKGMRYVRDALLAMPIAGLSVDKLVSGDFEKIANDYARERSGPGALDYVHFCSGAMEMVRKQGCCAGNPADKKNLDLNIKHTSKHHYGWHWSEHPQLWRMLCDAELDSTYDGLLTTAQAAKAAGVAGYFIRACIKRGLLPAKQGNVGKTCTYLINPADLLKLFPNANVVNVEPTFGAAHLAMPILRLLLLTSVRFSEVNEMEWDEINWQRKVWTIPAARTKAKRVHVVPMNDPALAILKKRLAHKDEASPFVFGYTPLLREPKVLCEGCVINHLKRITDDDKMTIHSFRRAAGSWAESQWISDGSYRAKYDGKFIRAVLGHAVSQGLDYIYRADANFEEPCRILLNDWTDYLIHGPSKPSESAEVVELSTRRTVGV